MTDLNEDGVPKISVNIPLSFAPSFEQVKSVGRIVASALVTWLISKNFVPDIFSGPVTEAISILLSVGVLSIWSAVANKRTALITKTAALKEVHAIIATPEIANVVFKDDPKIITAETVRRTTTGL